MRTTPRSLRTVLNLWPTYRFAGIRVEKIAEDWSFAEVSLRVRGLNRNAVGTAFGGTLFAMSDPFYMLLAMNRLGDGYVVWDQQASIQYLKPGRGIVRGRFELPDDAVARIVEGTQDGSKYLTWFESDLVDGEGAVVARIRRQLYVRRRT